MSFQTFFAFIVVLHAAVGTSSAQLVRLTPVSWSEGVIDLTIYQPQATELDILQDVSPYTAKLTVRSLIIESPGPRGNIVCQLRFKAVRHLLLTNVDTEHARRWFRRPEYQGHLESLTVTDTTLSDAWFEAIALLTKCETLDFMTCDLSNYDLTPLANMQSLRIFKWFFGSGSDAQVTSIARSKTIEVLRVEGDSITDECLDDIAAMIQLKTFMCRKTNITASGIEKLRQLRPDLRVLGK